MRACGASRGDRSPPLPNDPWLQRVLAALDRDEKFAPEDAKLFRIELLAGNFGVSIPVRLARRDQVIKALATQGLTDGRYKGNSDAARCIASQLVRYFASSFRKDRESERPAGEKGQLFDVLMLSGGRAIGYEAIRKCL
jgi:hypothetical protein